MTNRPHRRPGVSRRQFLGRSGLALGGLALGPALLSACGGSDSEGGSGGGGADELYIASWTSYIDSETVPLFTDETGIAVNYTEEFNDNNEYFAKIQPQLSTGKTIGPDIIIPTGWMVGRLINLGWVEKLPLDVMPNVANLEPSLQNPTWDPTGEYSLPWQAGTAGIAYNRKITGRDITSIEDLWDPAFKSQVALLTEWRDTLGLLGLAAGMDVENPKTDDLLALIEDLEQHVASGQIATFTGNDYMDDLATGNLGICMAWSGDAAQLALENPDIGYVIPDSGGILWADVMVIPKGSNMVEEAGKFMNFCYDPEHAARIAEEVQFISPVQGVKDILLAKGGDAAELAGNRVVFPTDEDYANLKRFGVLSEADEETIDAAFSKLQGN